MPMYLLVFSQAHLDFRQAEFQSVCQLFNISCEIIPSKIKHLQLFDFPNDDTVIKLLSRSMLIKSGYEVILSGHLHDEILQGFSDAPEIFESYDNQSDSWCLQVRPHGRKRNETYINKILQDFANAMPLKRAPIDLTRPINKFALVEDYSLDNEIYDRHVQAATKEIKPSHVYLCRFNRRYIGNSTMDPELSFLQANLTHILHGQLAMDPFCGTGGLLLAAAHFGASVLGTEIKYDVARAVGRSSRKGQLRLGEDESILANFVQYGLQQRHLGIILADSSRHLLWRIQQGIFDAIITDPPYGIRERGQRLGPRSATLINVTQSNENGTQSEEKFPEKTKYSITGVFLDLMNLSARLLCIGGHLSFWFPVCRSEYSEAVLPEHECMRLVHNCEQVLTRDTARRLLVYEKLRNPEQSDSAYFKKNCYETSTFRDKIFNQNLDCSLPTEKLNEK